MNLFQELRPPLEEAGKQLQEEIASLTARLQQLQDDQQRIDAIMRILDPRYGNGAAVREKLAPAEMQPQHH